MVKFFSIFFKILIPILILFSSFQAVKFMLANKPETVKQPAIDRTPTVKIDTFKAQDYTLTIKASGIVKAPFQTHLISEVGGRVKQIHPAFMSGGYIKKGDLLVVLDDTNYRDSSLIAKSNITSSQASLRQLDQEEKNTKNALKLTQLNLRTAEKNLIIAQKNSHNVERNESAIHHHIDLIQRNIDLVRRNLHLTQQNYALGNDELMRIKELTSQGLIARNVLDKEEQKIVQLKQAIIQQQQALLQQEQQLAQQEQSLIQQNQNKLSQEQQILQQELSINQQLQNIETHKGKLATFDSRRDAIKATIQSTKIRLKQEQRNQKRTQIRAPYDGRVLDTKIGIGQYVSPNTVLGSLYSTHHIEVDIPLSLTQYNNLTLSNQPLHNKTPQSVRFTLPFGNKKQQWEGEVTGTRPQLDPQSRQITLVARLKNTDNKASSQALKIGQYLKANIKGKTYNNIYSVPSSAIRQNREILIVQEQKVHIIPIKILWNDEPQVIIRPSESLVNQRVITTPLPQANEGMKVKLSTTQPSNNQES